MRKINLVICLFSFMLSLFPCACKKYEEGPLISFKSKEKRLVGKWLEVDEYGEALPTPEPFTWGRVSVFEFKADGEFSNSRVAANIASNTISTKVYHGRWSFDSKKENIKIYYTSGPTSLTYPTDEYDLTIQRLKYKELWYGVPGYYGLNTIYYERVE
ncbi:MAG TPA: hypothetical protein EYN69_03275 [Flavobacteriales bacterium]|nr:hypothetical protein [Flavobacteriales bacterium]